MADETSTPAQKAVKDFRDMGKIIEIYQNLDPVNREWVNARLRQLDQEKLVEQAAEAADPSTGG